MSRRKVIYKWTKRREKVDLKKLHVASGRTMKAKEVDIKQEAGAIGTANEKVLMRVIMMVLNSC